MSSTREEGSASGTTPVPRFGPVVETSDLTVAVTRVTLDAPPHDWPVDDPWTGWPTPEEPAAQDGSGPSRILVPYNGNAVAREALDVAANLSRGRSAVVWILYVRPWDVVRGGGRFCWETPDEARGCAQTAVTQLRRRGVAASAIVRDARREKVPRAIAAEAERLEVSCIVLGTHARPALGSALIGSTSLTVARRATRPIVLVKAPHKPRRRRPPWRSMRSLGDQAQS